MPRNGSVGLIIKIRYKHYYLLLSFEHWHLNRFLVDNNKHLMLMPDYLFPVHSLGVNP